MIQEKLGNLTLMIFDTRKEMGEKAANDATKCINELLKRKQEINCIFAAAPSQNEFLKYLAKKDIEWNRINAYHMDEYVGFGIGHKDSFNNFLTKAVFSRVHFKSVHLINGADDPYLEAERYSKLLDNIDVDITFMGIGENGHIAFNDPPVADFNDKKTVKIVELDQTCRQQQVNDKCFSDIDSVPRLALTVTIPKLTSSKYIFCIVPTEKKHNATKNALFGPVSEKCPASILRTKENVFLYIDKDCAGDIV